MKYLLVSITSIMFLYSCILYGSKPNTLKEIYYTYNDSLYGVVRQYHYTRQEQGTSLDNIPAKLDSLFTIAAQEYYKEHLNGLDVRNLQVSVKGFTTIVIKNIIHSVFNVEVEYLIFKDNELFQTHYKNWYWDLKEKKCYWYSDYMEKQKPNERYRGMWTSAYYMDFSKEDFAKNGFKILNSIKE